jgi:Na+:H+ antiporter
MVTLLLLLGTAMATALVVRRLAVPYTVALVAVGLLLGGLGVHPAIHLDPQLVLQVFLPVLLFEASLRVEFRPLRSALTGILVLAIPGVAVSLVVVAFILHAGIGMGLAAAALFGALISATDPVAVVALFRELRLPMPLTMLVEGESVLNDGTALVFYSLLLPAALGEHLLLANAAMEFAVAVLGGLGLGALLGVLGARLVALSEDHLVELGLTVLLAYGSFLGAGALHVSGVIAVVCAGLVFSSRSHRTLSSMAQSLLGDVWEFAAFLVNSILFLLIGLLVSPRSLIHSVNVLAWAIFAAIVGRLVVVYGLGLVLRAVRHNLVLRHSHLVFWSGLRGALSIAIVLTLPVAFPYRDLFLQMTLGVVLFTLLVQGLTLKPLLRWMLAGSAAPAA